MIIIIKTSYQTKISLKEAEKLLDDLVRKEIERRMAGPDPLLVERARKYPADPEWIKKQKQRITP